MPGLAMLLVGCGRLGYESGHPAGSAPLVIAPPGLSAPPLATGPAPPPPTAPSVPPADPSPAAPVIPVDAGSQPLDSGQVEPAPPTIMITEDFESVDAEAFWDEGTPWNPALNARDNTNVFSGQWALRATTNPLGKQNFLSVGIALPESRDAFIRFYAFVPELDPTSHTIMLELKHGNSDAGGVSEGKVAIDLRGDTGEVILLSAFNPRGVDTYVTQTMPLKEWVCIEMRVLVSATSGELQLWVNDQDQGINGTFPTSTGLTLNRLNFGLWQYLGTVPTTALYDDFVLSSSRVGCN